MGYCPVHTTYICKPVFSMGLFNQAPNSNLRYFLSNTPSVLRPHCFTNTAIIPLFTLRLSFIKTLKISWSKFLPPTSPQHPPSFLKRLEKSHDSLKPAVVASTTLWSLVSRRPCFEHPCLRFPPGSSQCLHQSPCFTNPQNKSTMRCK